MKIAIIHPWLPQYRVEFFKRLVSEGAARDIEIDVFYGATPPEWRARSDSGIPDGFTQLATRFLTFKSRSFNWKSIRSIRNLKSYDLIIVEQAVRNIETYELLLRGAPLAFWGHGRTYTRPVHAQQDRFKQWLGRRSKWFFAYTQGGQEAMIEAGMARERVSVVQNSIDTAGLHGAVRAIEESALSEFRTKHDLRGRTALYIGGLDASKRIPFLLKSAEIAACLDPDFRLLIAGTGDERDLVEDASSRCNYIQYLGAIFGPEKALAMASAQVIAMPGRVGLVAVDSFATLTPIVTTCWEWHSVEFEYLEPDTNAIVTANDVDSYAKGLIETLQDEDLMRRLKLSCDQARTVYTLDAMVNNFMGGILKALNGERT